jgi:hypothetical protein
MPAFAEAIRAACTTGGLLGNPRNGLPPQEEQWAGMAELEQTIPNALNLAHDRCFNSAALEFDTHR